MYSLWCYDLVDYVFHWDFFDSGLSDDACPSSHPSMNMFSLSKQWDSGTEYQKAGEDYHIDPTSITRRRGGTKSNELDTSTYQCADTSWGYPSYRWHCCSPDHNSFTYEDEETLFKWNKNCDENVDETRCNGALEANSWPDDENPVSKLEP